jgi:hypothetical protein
MPKIRRFFIVIQKTISFFSVDQVVLKELPDCYLNNSLSPTADICHFKGNYFDVRFTNDAKILVDNFASLYKKYI